MLRNLDYFSSGLFFCFLFPFPFSPFFELRRASPAKRGESKIAELAERSEAYRFSNIATVRDRREAAGALHH